MTATATMTVTRDLLRIHFNDAKKSGKPLSITFKSDAVPEVRYLALMLKANTIYCTKRHILDAVAASGRWDNVTDRSFELTVRPYADEEWFVERLWCGLERVTAS